MKKTELQEFIEELEKLIKKAKKAQKDGGGVQSLGGEGNAGTGNA